jgi:hypothetical protein
MLSSTTANAAASEVEKIRFPWSRAGSPSHQHNLLAGMGGAQIAAMVCPFKLT